ncbi:DNA-3-methyladenine glycosylase 2 [Serratia ficaria]|uniref:DNA-3-methyladenine glycosylase II n=2 Tax=Serratia ficaria TaxID=61651 RepID=A0A240C9I7_SERFI|nr:DNA-3-methyladenine glycosylase II [Serratia ficaria]CAI0713181.1 DNA-3-methyladenine glycosylase 2 [Serratia ficaria]CAI0874571.1 DNA-3-methyladenine glycosylase 2 [Serratia ficaria]CAI1111814.1 DNA-3-methyladenine glycosylase 2 [Serratia ficaria]CAI1121340.1 DNA-3-methyladenine glycosylase 2 [Serratia ficaria]
MSEFRTSARQAGAIMHKKLTPSVAMNYSQQAFYEALRARDRKFDGRFFVGVSSTGIYCRPVCSARTPKIENCTFYPSAAAAELAGFRPCLKCRPELAPGLALIDLGNRYAQVAVQLIEQGYLSEHSCEQLAARLGISDRHLRRIFAEQFGASPIDYAQSHRLLQAKRLLADTDLPLSEVAFAAGFGSLRRFNELFKARYRLIPSALRSGRNARTAASGLVFHLGYRPPYDWPRMLNFLQARAVQGVERVEGRQYLRSIAVSLGGTEYRGWISVQPEEAHNRVRVEIAPSLSRATTEVLRRIRQLFDLDAAPDLIAQALGALAADAPGLRLPGCVNSFEQAVRAVLGQLVSVKMAATFAGRMAERWGTPLEQPQDGITHVFPSAERVAQLQPEALRPLGVQLKRAAALIEIARAHGEGRLQLDNVLDIEQGIKALTALPGIGSWTASYIAMRAWSWPDVFLAGDYLIKQRFPGMTPRQIERYAERWRPWRSYATLHLWHNDGWAPLAE